MTADERIEKLLNRFGQTISDLPKANDYKRNRRMIKTMISAENCADDWYNPDCSYDFYQYAYPAYICHLADIIDRMEIALETAAKCTSCIPCANSYDYCGGSCDFRIDDKYLSDVSEEDTKRYIDDAE